MTMNATTSPSALAGGTANGRHARMNPEIAAQTLRADSGNDGWNRTDLLPRMIAHFQGLSGQFGTRVLTFVLTIAAALIASVPMIWLAGSELWLTASALFGGALGSGPAIAETMVQMIPLLIAGLAVALAFHASLFNIGVEGQLLFGGLVTGVVGATVDLPPPLLMVVCLLAGMAGGAAFALIPALLKAYRGAHEVVTTIMMNFVALAVSEYAVAPTGPFVAADQPSATERVPTGTQLPIIWEGTRLHAGLLVALGAVGVGVWGRSATVSAARYHDSFAVPDEEARENRFELAVPNGASWILTHHADGVVPGVHAAALHRGPTKLRGRRVRTGGARVGPNWKPLGR